MTLNRYRHFVPGYDQAVPPGQNTFDRPALNRYEAERTVPTRFPGPRSIVGNINKDRERERLGKEARRNWDPLPDPGALPLFQAFP
jgi:hypothetical protein